MLAIGYPSNGKTPGETVHAKVGYFLTGLMCNVHTLGCVIEGGFLTDSNWNMIKSCADG